MRQFEHLRPDHDETLVARLVADDLAGREADAARALVAECPACAELLADLRAIASATTALPATRRPRDFRLTQADAVRLRPAGWRRFLSRFGEPDLSFTRPLAMGLTTLGIAGLLLSALPGGFGLGSAASPEAAGGTYYESAPAASGLRELAPSPAAVMAPSAAFGAFSSAAPAPAGSSPASGDGSGATKSAGAPDEGAQALPASRPPAERAAAGPSPLLVLSVVVLLAGLGLGGLRVAARRLA